MEIFKSEEIKKEYKEYLTLLDDVLECGFCRKLSCKYEKKFNPICNLCRDAKCKKCEKLLISLEILKKTAMKMGRNIFLIIPLII